MRPNAFIAWSTAAFACASLATSNWANATFSPAKSRRAFRTLSRLRPVATTRSPAFNAALAVAAPMPLPAPVMNQTLLMFNSRHASLKGSWRCGLPVSRAMALANAGASGGRPGSPMPVGGSALGTMWTSNSGMSVMRATVKSPKLLCSTTPSLSVMAEPGRHIDRPMTAAPCTWASTVRGFTARLQCTPAVTRCSTGRPSFTEASTT